MVFIDACCNKDERICFKRLNQVLFFCFTEKLWTSPLNSPYVYPQSGTYISAAWTADLGGLGLIPHMLQCIDLVWTPSIALDRIGRNSIFPARFYLSIALVVASLQRALRTHVEVSKTFSHPYGKCFVCNPWIFSISPALFPVFPRPLY